MAKVRLNRAKNWGEVSQKVSQKKCSKVFEGAEGRLSRARKKFAVCNAEGDPVRTVVQAVEEMHRLKVKRAEDDLPKLGRTPASASV